MLVKESEKYSSQASSLCCDGRTLEGGEKAAKCLLARSYFLVWFSTVSVEQNICSLDSVRIIYKEN